MMVLTRLFTLAMTLASATAGTAATLTIEDTKSGAAAPETVFAQTTTNGDFTVISAVSGPSTLNDATNERTRWSHDLSGLYSADFTDLISAVLTLTWRAGGDNQANDNLYLAGQVVSSLAGTVTGTIYTTRFDLLAAHSEAVILGILNRETNRGVFAFETADDSAAITATLAIQGVNALPSVPLPATGFALGAGLFGLAAFRRKAS